jgi:transposase
MLEKIVEPLLAAREAMWREFAKLHREVLLIVKEDQVCRRLMTVPGVGALVSLTYRAGVDDPGRFTKSKSVGAFFGLTPTRYQSGETDLTGGITRVGDASVRTALPMRC